MHLETRRQCPFVDEIQVFNICKREYTDTGGHSDKNSSTWGYIIFSNILHMVVSDGLHIKPLAPLHNAIKYG